MADVDSLFVNLAVKRGVVSEAIARACLDARARNPALNLPQLVAERGRIAPDMARSLYQEAQRLAQQPGYGDDIGAYISDAHPVGAGLASSAHGHTPTPTSGLGTPAPWGPSSSGGGARPGGDGGQALTPSALRPGMSFNRYLLEAELGRGGMGVVWRARQVDLDRDVAIKMLLQGQLAHEKLRGRFVQEARAVARLVHPNVVTVHDVGEEQGILFFTMDLVDGPSLSQLLKTERITLERALELAHGIAEGLEIAHRQGIVHRDLKPANILIDPRGTPRITDFGIAKDTTAQSTTMVGEVLGTPAYMAPEQAEGAGRDVDGRADVYSLGSILYRMLTGTPPFTGDTPYDIITKVISEEPVPPRKKDRTIPRELDELVLRCLAKKREDRPASAAEVARELQAIREALGGGGHGALFAAGGAGRVVAAALVVLVLLGGGVGFELWRRLEAAEVAAEALERERVERLERERLAELKRRRDEAQRKTREAEKLAPSLPEDALALASEAAQLLPDDLQAQVVHARLLLNVRRDPRAALAALDRARPTPGAAGPEAQAVAREALYLRGRGLVMLLASGGAREQDVEAVARQLEARGREGRAEAAELLASTAQARGDSARAIEQLERAVREAPDVARLRLGLVELLLESRRFAAAEEQAGNAIGLDPESARARAMRAKARLELGRFEAAEEDAQAALAIDRQEPLGVEVLAELERRRPDPPEHDAGQPLHEQTHAALKAGLAALQRRDATRALEQLRVALREGQLTCKTALWQRASLSLGLRQAKVAVHDLEALQQLGERTSRVMSALATAHLQLGENQQALAQLDAAIRAHPDDAALYRLRGDVYKALGAKERAIEEYGQSLARDADHAETRHQRAHLLLELGRAQEALADVKTILAANPAGGHFQLMQGECFAALGQYEEARAALQVALEKGSAKDQAEARAKLDELAGREQ